MLLRTLLLLTILSIPSSIWAQTSKSINEILILGEGDKAPTATAIGKVKIVDKGFKIVCDYETTMRQAREKALDMGGNVIKITKLKQPGFVSSCWQLWGDVYKVDDMSKLLEQNVPDENMPTDADYALLYVFRPNSGYGGLISYNLHLDDSIIYRVTNNTAQVFKIYKEGNTKLWARTEARDEVELDVKHGESYYLQCGVSMGMLAGRPSLTLVSKNIGRYEYAKVSQTKSTKKDDIYTEKKQ
jgi:hypothetical protein